MTFNLTMLIPYINATMFCLLEHFQVYSFQPIMTDRNLLISDLLTLIVVK